MSEKLEWAKQIVDKTIKSITEESENHWKYGIDTYSGTFGQHIPYFTKEEWEDVKDKKQSTPKAR